MLTFTLSSVNSLCPDVLVFFFLFSRSHLDRRGCFEALSRGVANVVAYCRGGGARRWAGQCATGRWTSGRGRWGARRTDWREGPWAPRPTMPCPSCPLVAPSSFFSFFSSLPLNASHARGFGLFFFLRGNVRKEANGRHLRQRLFVLQRWQKFAGSRRRRRRKRLPVFRRLALEGQGNTFSKSKTLVIS